MLRAYEQMDPGDRKKALDARRRREAAVLEDVGSASRRPKRTRPVLLTCPLVRGVLESSRDLLREDDVGGADVRTIAGSARAAARASRLTQANRVLSLQRLALFDFLNDERRWGGDDYEASTAFLIASATDADLERAESSLRAKLRWHRRLARMADFDAAHQALIDIDSGAFVSWAKDETADWPLLAALPPHLRKLVPLIQRGMTDKEIAHELGVRSATARAEVRDLLALVGARGRVDLSRRLGLIV